MQESGVKGAVFAAVVAVLASCGSARADLVFEAVRAEDMPGSGKGVSFSHDGLRLYITTSTGVLPSGYGSRDIWVIERESVGAPWGEPVNLGPNINTDDHEGWPVISPDELELYFGRGPDDGTQRWMCSTRASKEDPWGPAVEYTGIFPDDFSSDGLEKYTYGPNGGHGGQDIWVMTRATADDDWGHPINLGPNVNDSQNQIRPTISGDGLALFFISLPPYRLCLSVRATRDDRWGPAVDVGSPVNGSWWIVFPEISPDGSTLYCNRGGGRGFTQVSIKPMVDFTGDGLVDLFDLLDMIDHWGTDHSFYDIGPAAWGDGVVDDADLEVLMSHYGQAVDYSAQTVVDATPPHAPKPADGCITDLEHALPIEWKTGDTATLHDLYFGADRDVVANADVSDTTGIYRGPQEGNSYTPPEGLDENQTYYWRIDEIRGDSAARGDIWTFTVADYLIVDDFERYDHDLDAGTTIWHTWIDGIDNGTGSLSGYPFPSGGTFGETTIVHTGDQAMPLTYDNDGTVFEGDPEWETTGVPYYSDVQRTWDDPRDWTRRGVTTLTLWFVGEEGNAPEPLSVVLQDDAGNTAVVPHPIPAIATATTWQEWPIPLTDFAGVDLTAIKMMTIRLGDPTSEQPGGSGILYIDDITLE